MKNKSILSIACCILGISLMHQAVAQDLDLRLASVNCHVREGDLLSCQYRTSANLSVKDVSLKINGEMVQIPEGGLTNFPAEGQKAAALILVDTSDPSRRSTVEEKSSQIVKLFLSSQKTYEEYGLATFDSELQLLAPVGTSAEDIGKEIKKIKASGQSTEFYKSVLAAIEIVGKNTADRKGLVIISDGKDEDKAYKLEDVVKAAKSANVSILGIGIAEKPSDSPHLQTLKRLADETYGQFINASTGSLGSDFQGKPLGFLEKGGEIRLDGKSYHGIKEIRVVLGTKDDKAIELNTSVDFSSGRSVWRKAIGIFLSNWIWFVLVSLPTLALLIGVMKLKKMRVSKLPPVINYAYLDEMDGLGTRHSLQKTAIRIGRNKDNDVVLTNDSISSHHAEIHMRREGTFYIVDLSSTNGVLVNDGLIDQFELHNGDIIELGEVRLRFSIANLFEGGV